MLKIKTSRGKGDLKKACKALSFPSPIIKKRLDSTSTHLRHLADDGAAHGTIVIADRQSAGRGRTGKSFLSPDGGLYMSLLIRDKLFSSAVDIITPTAAVAASMAIKDALGADVSVKWVNDLFHEGKKVCGILTEAVRDASSGDIKYVVLGIGINVFEPQGGFGELSDIAASLLREKKDADVIHHLASLITEYFFRLWDTDKIDIIYSEYKKRLFILDRGISVIRGEESIPAKVIDLEKDFSLTVEYGDGRHERLNSGEISIIPHVNS